MSSINNLIICNPYEEPSQHWKYDRARRRFDLVSGRRPAGFLIASQDSQTFDDPGEFRELELVNRIRDRVNSWRDKNHPGITGITRQLLQFWGDKTRREYQFFFCQLEAIETLIWLIETPSSEKQGLDIPSDGGLFQRLCCKMATGSGKTIVMAMVIVWQIVNKTTYPRDTRFSKNILVMAPGLTVKLRLQVLLPERDDNFYDHFSIVPEAFYESLRRGKIIIHNWHRLMPEIDAVRSVVKLGEEGDMVFAKRILEHDLKNIIVINDEAHHAYRVKSEEQTKGIPKRELERDKRWIEGLDKLHRARNITHCFDFSATPFVPSGKNATEDALFGWIVSDFSLNDAIESGLTKTPRIAIRDDSNKFDELYRSRFYHLYRDAEIKPDLNRNAKETEKLPDLVANAYFLLGHDWVETKKAWDEKRSRIPPVMITVCNKTHTAARIRYSFEHDKFGIKELSEKRHLLHIDSSVLDKIESETESDEFLNLRNIVDTVGKTGKPGEQIRNIVAVQMLSEGWDARNVTHIMGLRAFSSQLLCEQVVGRGLRRTSYEVNPETGLFSPEYVNVFGVPFTFLPHEGGLGTPPPPPQPTTIIEPDPDKAEHEISWPSVDRIDVDYDPKLAVDWTLISDLELRSNGISTTVGMAQVLAGKPHADKMSEIDLYELNKEIRLQRIVFVAARDVYDSMSPDWKGNKEYLLAQVVGLVEGFIHSGKIDVTDVVDDPLRTKVTILFNMQRVVKHVWRAIRSFNVEKKQLVLNQTKSIKSTSDMRPWYTKKPTIEYPTKSHINLAPYDSGWELGTEQELERNRKVMSWVKNDHIGFGIRYLYNGIIHDYWPDFLIRLDNGVTMVLEIKGVDDEQNRAKRAYLEEWVDAVNENGGYGAWTWDVVFYPSEVRKIISKHAKIEISAKEYAKCPQCRKSVQSIQKIEREFGFRNVNGIVKPQSWCKTCRKKQ